jgi:hypothetical protein
VGNHARTRQLSIGRLLAVGIVAGALLPACALLDLDIEAPAGYRAVHPVGRSACPGSVPEVLTNLHGEALVGALEELQATYQADPGFMAVVFDGEQPIIIVEAATLPEWQRRVAPLGLTVAPSCVDPELLAAVHAVLPNVVLPDGSVSAGHNALKDAIEVMGVEADTLLDALEEHAPGTRDVALDAIADGTLRIDERPLPRMR